ncbi:hypothetical protein FNV43_RR17080 [Rhamnella rubrinervis]|uniref:Uncharacterized protein n=1 Tax=Rhamnella rubrinervis TaxID=2594499 RepID=A0A8K0GZY7_9ROSA|nr:hypothetical protein FNV43_RR17080 [Rhamnella rubrinervis]
MASFDPAWEMPVKAINFSNCSTRMDSMATVYDLGAGKFQAGRQLFSGGFKNLIGKDLARGIGIPIKFDHSTIARNYGHYVGVLVDVDLAGFVLEKLLLETTDDCIEVDLYFESFPNFCTSCHSAGDSVAKCKSVIGKAPPKVGSDEKEKENKAPGNATSRTDLNIEVGKSVRITSERVWTPSYYRHITSWEDTFGDSDDELDDYIDDRVEEEWPPLQGKGSSNPSKEFDSSIMKDKREMLSINQKWMPPPCSHNLLLEE